MKGQLGWFFDKDVRDEIDRISLDVNDEMRVIDNVMDDIDVEWKRLKPLYGIYSKVTPRKVNRRCSSWKSLISFLSS